MRALLSLIQDRHPRQAVGDRLRLKYYERFGEHPNLSTSFIIDLWDANTYAPNVMIQTEETLADMREEVASGIAC